MDATFREPTEADLNQVLAFMRELYTEDGSAPLVPDRAAEALRELLRDPAHGRVWLIEVSRMAAGYLVVTWGFSLEFHGRDAFIDELYVAPHRIAARGSAAWQWSLPKKSAGPGACGPCISRSNLGTSGLRPYTGTEVLPGAATTSRPSDWRNSARSPRASGG